MKYTPIWAQKRMRVWLGCRLHALAAVSLVLLMLLGHSPESKMGWVAYAPRVTGWPRRGRRQNKNRLRVLWSIDVKVGWEHLRHTWMRALARSALLVVMWLVRDVEGGGGWWLLDWAPMVPWVEWVLEGGMVAWPWLGQQPEMRVVRWGIRWLRWGSLLLLSVEIVGQWLTSDVSWSQGREGFEGVGYLAGCVVQKQSKEGGAKDCRRLPISVKRVAGGWEVWFGDEFYLPVKEGDPFQLRQTILFLRQLEAPVERQGSRATRDGRRPLIPQQQLEAWFGVPQPNISRWERYRLEGDWANLMSLHSAEVLTTELREQIMDVCARFPWWGQKRVYEYLREQGIAVTHPQVRQAMRESGWRRLRETMRCFFVVSADCIRPRDEGLVEALLELLQTLLGKLDAGEGLTPEERLEVAHLQTACEELGLTPPPALPAVPWAQKLEWVLFAAETSAEEGVIRCTYCGSADVRPKGRKPRLKRYLDEQNQWRAVEVYRYRCLNPACSYGSFTHFPLGLLPYSPYPLQMRVIALQMYAWGRSSYRRTAQALGLRAGRAYLWVSTFGRELLPIAALFGVLRYSGVVGIDEKWVQVPDKAPRGSGRSRPSKPRRWMYVYLAVDIYTYDLLHIAIYAHNTAHSTRAFLLALKAKGYKPKVILTDLRPEYGPAIEEIFDQARHHECLFHASQWMHRQLKEVYGADYAKTHPEVVKLRKQIDAIFQAKTRCTAEKRYAKVMALRDKYVTHTPEADSVFDSLERHWPKLVNGIESTIIPRTNNATELVIRRFDQHYQNFCGFESLQSARLFLAVFEKVYRFTSFTQDAQPRIRGKCPLELAGYDISKLPMAQICRGWALSWPTHPAKEVVPNV